MVATALCDALMTPGGTGAVKSGSSETTDEIVSGEYPVLVIVTAPVERHPISMLSRVMPDCDNANPGRRDRYAIVVYTEPELPLLSNPKPAPPVTTAIPVRSTAIALASSSPEEGPLYGIDHCRMPSVEYMIVSKSVEAPPIELVPVMKTLEKESIAIQEKYSWPSAEPLTRASHCWIPPELYFRVA